MQCKIDGFFEVALPWHNDNEMAKDKVILKKSKRRESLSLRQALFLGAGLSMLFPALVLAYFQFTSRFASEEQLRVRIPMQQYADVLSRGLAISLWNVDRGAANELLEAVMRNQDVVSVTVSDELGKVFAQTNNATHTDTIP